MLSVTRFTFKPQCQYQHWENGRAASEEVILELAKSKCFPILLHGLDCFFLPKADLKSLDFVVTRFLNSSSRLATTSINDCRQF